MEEGYGSLRAGQIVVHMSVGAALVLVLFMLHIQFIRFDNTTLIAIGFFNFLFLFLLFPLKGPLLRKTMLLVAGNVVGVLWYLIQLSFKESFLFLSVDTFKVLGLVVKPLIDFMWVVAVWSLSLSLVASYKAKSERLKEID